MIRQHGWKVEYELSTMVPRLLRTDSRLTDGHEKMPVDMWMDKWNHVLLLSTCLAPVWDGGVFRDLMTRTVALLLPGLPLLLAVSALSPKTTPGRISSSQSREQPEQIGEDIALSNTTW